MYMGDFPKGMFYVFDRSSLEVVVDPSKYREYYELLVHVAFRFGILWPYTGKPFARAIGIKVGGEDLT